MQYYLDTNMLLFILLKQADDINHKIASIINDYSSILYVSSVAVQELLLLYRIGKIKVKQYQSEKDILADIQKLQIEIVFFNQHHLETYTSLQIANAHKDMNDHAIISQAISDKISVISSDAKFKDYSSQGLKFVYNKR